MATSVFMQCVRESRIFRERWNTPMRSCRIWKRPEFWKIGWCIVPRTAAPTLISRLTEKMHSSGVLTDNMVHDSDLEWPPISNFPYVMHYYQHRLHRLTFLHSKHHGYLLRISIFQPLLVIRNMLKAIGLFVPLLANGASICSGFKFAISNLISEGASLN